MRYSKPVWTMIQEALAELGELSYSSTVAWIERHYPKDNVNHGTIQAQLIACSVNHSSAHYYPDPNRFLFHLGHGRYRRYNAEKDGLWQITANGAVRVEESKEKNLPFSTMDSASRILIPPQVCAKLGLAPGSAVAFLYEDGKVYLRKGRLKFDLD
jgi:AbrB family looped-hinge helix DNA binding protein